LAISLTPRLVVRGADDALDFYRRAFGAEIVERYVDEANVVVHAAFSIGGAVVALTEERHEWNNNAADSLGGSPVLLNLVVDDADAVGERLEAAGAQAVFPIADQYYGHREGRFRDPYGHLWIITTIVEKLSLSEVQALSLDR